MSKKYHFDRYERLLGKVSRRVFTAMHEVAREYDLNEGGVYDQRGGGAINLWVAPEDKPEDWCWKITKGALNFPREYLAGIFPRWTSEDEVELYLVIRNYARRDEAEELFNKGKISYSEYKRRLELTQKGTDAEVKWCLEKFKWLLEKAKEKAKYRWVIKCPFCGLEGFENKLFNVFIEHLAKHGKVIDITMTNSGYVVRMEGCILTPEDYLIRRFD